MLNQKEGKNQVNSIGAVKAKKSLGQNFLVDKNIITFIVDSLEIKPKDTIVEIGPGHGELTEKILENKPDKVITIEKDERLAKEIARNFQFKIFNFQSILNEEIFKQNSIIVGDALKVIRNWKLEIGNFTNYKLVGNIPYYITGHLLRIISELESKPKLIILTIQKEVAERICAKPPHMNLLAASVQLWGEPELLKVINKNKFNPVPKVDSAVIRIVTSNKQPVNSQDFYKFIKILFKQPRKTILNNLKDGVKRGELSESELKNIIEKSTMDLELRPQNLSVKDIKKIAQGMYFKPKN